MQAHPACKSNAHEQLAAATTNAGTAVINLTFCRAATQSQDCCAQKAAGRKCLQHPTTLMTTNFSWASFIVEQHMVLLIGRSRHNITYDNAKCTSWPDSAAIKLGRHVNAIRLLMEVRHPEIVKQIWEWVRPKSRILCAMSKDCTTGSPFWD